MTLCEDCVKSENDPMHCLYGTAPCCKARDVANTPRPGMAAAFKAAVDGLDEATAAWVRDRAYELIRAKGRA